MARSRTTPSKSTARRTTAPKPQPANVVEDVKTDATKENKKMANVLDAATITALLSKQKSRGDYDAELAAFLTSGEAGIEVPLTEGRFAGKTAAQVKTGLDNARKRTNEAGALVHAGGQNVKVIAVTEGEGEEAVGHVYLINTGVSATDDDE